MLLKGKQNFGEIGQMMSKQSAMKKARQILKKKGFADNEIHQDFWLKDYRIDLVGWNPTHRVAVECGYCAPKKKQDLERFFDEVVCLPLEPYSESVSVEPSPRRVLARMRLMLVKDDGVVFEAPLSKAQWSKQSLENEVQSMERDFEQSSKLFTALSHENRLRMMKLLIEDDDLSIGFAEFIHDLGLNPKLVWENTRKLREGGLLEKSENGRYRFSEFGEASFIMLGLVLRRLREMFEDAEGGE